MSEWTSNHRDCLRALVGRKIRGVLFDALPVNRRDLSHGNNTFVFEDGTGFTFGDNGSYWREDEREIRRAIEIERERLEEAKKLIEDVNVAAGNDPRLSLQSATASGGEAAGKGK